MASTSKGSLPAEESAASPASNASPPPPSRARTTDLPSSPPRLLCIRSQPPPLAASTPSKSECSFSTEEAVASTASNASPPPPSRARTTDLPSSLPRLLCTRSQPPPLAASTPSKSECSFSTEEAVASTASNASLPPPSRASDEDILSSPTRPLSPRSPPPPLAALKAPFPRSLVGSYARFICRCTTYSCRVAEILRSKQKGFMVVTVRIPGPVPKRPFSEGEAAMLDIDGARWSGMVDAVPDDAYLNEFLHTYVWIQIPDQGEYKKEKRVLLHVYSLDPKEEEEEEEGDEGDCVAGPWRCVNLIENKKKDKEKEDEAAQPSVKIGLKGFGPVGRLAAEVLLESFDLKLVAVCDTSDVENMVSLWTSTKISLRLGADKTLRFRRFNHESFPPAEELVVKFFSLSKLEDTAWIAKASVDIVVDSLDLVPDDKDIVNDNDKNVLHCLTYFPKVILAHGLLSYGPANVPMKKLQIIVSSELVHKAFLVLFPEWDGESTHMKFHARHLNLPTMWDMDIIVSLEKASTERLSTSKLSGAKSLVSLLSCCVDMIRRVPVDGCRVELF